MRMETSDSLDLAPRVVKVDVEGAEVATLRGMRRTLMAHRPILMCERNEDPDFLALPAELGFGSYAYVAEKNQMWRFDGAIPSLNVFFLHPDRVAELRARGVDVRDC